jgi:hypothetical protein
MGTYVILQERPNDFSTGDVLVSLNEFEVESDKQARALFDAFLNEHGGEEVIQVGLYELRNLYCNAATHLDSSGVKNIVTTGWNGKKKSYGLLE